MDSAPLVAMLGMLGCACASFLFTLAESALFSLGNWRAKHLAQEVPGAGGQGLRLLPQPRDLLAAIVLGNTFANTALIAIGLWMSYGNGGSSLTWTMLGVFVLILFGCEVVPKTLAMRMPERWALQLAAPLTLFVKLIAPCLRFVQKMTDVVVARFVPANIKPMSGTTDEDYQELLDLAYQQGTMAQSEKEIILEIISLDKQTVGDVMSKKTEPNIILNVWY